ncbi:LPS assembly lipoprotein LptE [Undibacterium arcticum]|uniref:LPS-assembly lipoprotein LptE n=2 Tax=Undibacterium arcticum TaxID=1762892 RepID=A0ABV7F7R5_9BURK
MFKMQFSKAQNAGHLLAQVRGYALLVLAACALSACGFHLRGSTGKTSLPFKSIYVALPESSPLGAELKRNLRAGGDTTVVADPKAAQVVMEVLSEAKNKQILSLNSQGRVREYSLTYTLVFRVKDSQEREVLAPTEITLKRAISYNENQALANESEEALLYRDIQTDLVQQLMRRLGALRLAP